MAATSSWGLGAHKMTADISSSTPVASPPPVESPLKANSFSKGNCTEAQGAKATAAVVAAATHRKVGEGSEAAATSSDSDSDEEEEERGGSTSAPGRAESEAGGAKATQANGHHGPLKPTVSAGGKAGAKAPAARSEVDEHAARASDAAKAAVAAVLASATMLPSSPHPSKSAAPPATKIKEESAGAAVHSGHAAADADCSRARRAGGRRGPGGAARKAVAVFWTPQTNDLPDRVEPRDVERAMAAAGFIQRWNAVACKVSKSANMRVDKDSNRALPAPLVLPTGSMPCMVGTFRVNESEGTHRCSGTWAMTKADLDAASKVEARASPFEFRVRAGPESFPYSGSYKGYFLVRQPPKPVTRIDEDDLNLSFEKNSEGTWNVKGGGCNIYGSFTIIGHLNNRRRLQVYRLYAKAPARGHRRASVSSTAPVTSSARGTGATSSERLNRGKHPRSAPTPPRAVPALPLVSANDATTLQTGPTARRVKRTPSYLIKDIGSDGNAHLSNGLRRCVTLLKGLMNIRGKSDWFDKPVDHVGLRLYDYLDIIKRPMDLGTVRSKLEGGKYQTTAEFAADVRLVFSNARLYNSDPNSLVHTAARHLFETFESRFAALGSNLDDPPSKRRKSNNGGGSGSGSGGASNNSTGTEAVQQTDTQKKRKSVGGGKAIGDGGHGDRSRLKKARSAPVSKAAPSKPAPVSQPAASPSLAPVASSTIEQSSAMSHQPDSQFALMQRRMAEMEAQILRMQEEHAKVTAAAAAAGVSCQSQPEAHQKQPRKSKGGVAKSGEGSKAGSKKGGSSRGGGKGSKSGAKSEKAAAEKLAKSAKASKASKAAAAAAKAEAEAKAAEVAANAAVPMTFDEKKALSYAINKLDQNNLTRVVEIIQARMPLGSSDEEIELDIDSMDNLTLRDLQAYIMELSASGSHQNGGADSDSDEDAW